MIKVGYEETVAHRDRMRPGTSRSLAQPVSAAGPSVTGNGVASEVTVAGRTASRGIPATTGRGVRLLRGVFDGSETGGLLRAAGRAHEGVREEREIPASL